MRSVKQGSKGREVSIPSGDGTSLEEVVRALPDELAAAILRHLGGRANAATVSGTSPLVDSVKAAGLIGIAPVTLRAWRHEQREKQPPYIKLPSGRIRYRQSDLTEWLEQQTKRY